MNRDVYDRAFAVAARRGLPVRRNPLPYNMTQEEFDRYAIEWNYYDRLIDRETRSLDQTKSWLSNAPNEEAAHWKTKVQEHQQEIEYLIRERDEHRRQLGSSPSDRSRPLALSLRVPANDKQHFYVLARLSDRPAFETWLDSPHRALMVGDQVLFKFDIPDRGGTASVSSSFVPLSDTTFQEVKSAGSGFLYVKLDNGKLLAPIDGIGETKRFITFDIPPDSLSLIVKEWPNLTTSVTRRSSVNFDVTYPSQADVEAFWESAQHDPYQTRLESEGMPFEGILDFNKSDADEDLVAKLRSEGVKSNTPVLVVPSAYGNKQFYEIYYIVSLSSKDPLTGTIEHFQVPQRSVVRSETHPLDSVLSVIWRRPGAIRQASSGSSVPPEITAPPSQPSPAPVAPPRSVPPQAAAVSITLPSGQNQIFVKKLPADSSYSVVCYPSGEYYVLDSAGNPVCGPTLFFKATRFVPSKSNPSGHDSEYTVEHDGRRYVILRDGSDTGKYAFSEEKANTLVERMKGNRRPRRPRRGES